mgnify:CR=1 FL=1
MVFDSRLIPVDANLRPSSLHGQGLGEVLVVALQAGPSRHVEKAAEAVFWVSAFPHVMVSALLLLSSHALLEDPLRATALLQLSLGASLAVALGWFALALRVGRIERHEAEALLELR